MKIEIIDITPTMAKEILSRNTHNRPSREKYADTLARDMAEGRWVTNGETIKVATTHQVIDGQHRLEAAIRADYTLKDVVLVSGLPMEAQATVDIGRNRTAADNLGLNGHKNAAVLAAVARRSWQWGQGNTKFNNTAIPTHTEIAAFVEANSRIHRSAEIAASTRTAFRVTKQSVVGTAHFILLGVDSGEAAEFFAQLAHGAALSEGHPVLALRNRLLNDRAMGKLNPFHQDVAFIFRAWNAQREGRALTRIQHTAAEPMILPL